MTISSALFYQLISAILTAVLAFSAIVQTYNSLKFGLYARMEPKYVKGGGQYMVPVIGNTGPGVVKNINWTLQVYSPGETGFDIMYNDEGKIAFIPPQTSLEIDSGLPRYITPLESKVNVGNPDFVPEVEEYRSFELTLDRKRFFLIAVSSRFNFDAEGRLSGYQRKIHLGEMAKNKKKRSVHKKRKNFNRKKDKLF